MIRRCSCHGRRFCLWAFIQTVGFFPEHLLWEKAPGFANLTHLLGL